MKKNQNYTNKKNICFNNNVSYFKEPRRRTNRKSLNPEVNKKREYIDSVKTKYIKKDKKILKDSGVMWIGLIPKDWKVKRMKSACSIITDFTSNGSFADLAKNVKYLDSESYAMLVRTADLSGNRDTQPIYIDKHAYDYLSKSKLNGGELIFPNIGSVGDIYMYRPLFPKASLAPNAIMVRTKEVSRYLYYLFSTDQAKDALKSLGNRSVQAKFNKTQLRNMKIVIPPFAEQLRIAFYLDERCKVLDDTIDAVSQQIEDLEKYKKALITKTVTKGICKKGEPERAMKDSGVEWIGEVPEEWSVKRLKYVLDSIRNGAPAAAVEYSPELPRYVRITDIDDNGRLKETGKQSLPEDIAKRYMLDKEAVLIASVGNTVGKPCLYEPGNETCAFAGYLIEAIANPKVMINKFLFYYILSDDYRNWLNRSFTQTTIPNASAGRHKNLPVTVPPLAEQQQIADYLDEKCKNIDNRVQKRKQQLEWLKEYKKSLIFDYVTGKKRVEK